MSNIKSVCVFCGSSNRVAQKYLDIAYKFGSLLAKNNLHLVYGAGDCGLMGQVAQGVVDNSGTVTGVFPKVLVGIEAEYKGLTETIIVDDMHTRKMHMFSRADAFVILPGGFGTMDETFEVITWKQLHTHDKPIILLNFDNFWDNWAKLTDQFIEMGFAHRQAKDLYEIVDDCDTVISRLKAEISLYQETSNN